MTVLNSNIPFLKYYNYWHMQEITPQFEVDKWRGNLVNGQFVEICCNRLFVNERMHFSKLRLLCQVCIYHSLDSLRVRLK
jgi:hypothetical protein